MLATGWWWRSGAKKAPKKRALQHLAQEGSPLVGGALRGHGVLKGHCALKGHGTLKLHGALTDTLKGRGALKGHGAINGAFKWHESERKGLSCISSRGS